MIHLYHGLFGSTGDWESILGLTEPCVRHDLYEENLSAILSLKTAPEDILMGYSMGGRIALEIALRNSFNLRKLVLISTHPGLRDDELCDRRVFEEDTLKKMRSLSPEAFEDYWNNLPLFRSSKISLGQDSDFLMKSAELFENFKLSSQPQRPEILKQHHEKILWITGTKDEKYKTIIQERVQPLGIKTYETLTDHRALKDSRKIKSILLNEGLL